MKSKGKHCILRSVVMAVSAVFVIITTAEAREKIQLVSFDYPPYYSETYIKDKGHGFVSDIVTAAFDAADVEAVISYQPIARSAASFKEGKFAAYVGSKQVLLSVINESEADFLNLCTYYMRINYFKSHVKKDLKNAKLEELKGYKIGDIVGSQRVEKLKNAGLAVELAPKLENGMMKLANGRIDLWVAVGLTAYSMVEANFPDRLNDLDFISEPLGSGTVDISFLKTGKDAEKNRSLYEKGLKTIRDNGVFQEIMGRYFGKGVVFEEALSSCP